MEIETYPLKVIPDARGRIYHFMRKDMPQFENFDVQEVYFSLIYPGAVKAWHRHKRMILNYVVPVGNIKLVCVDQNNDLHKFFLGENCPHQMVRIPPMVWNGFMAVDGKPALVANITDVIHDPNEIERCDPAHFERTEFCYNWLEDTLG